MITKNAGTVNISMGNFGIWRMLRLLAWMTKIATCFTTNNVKGDLLNCAREKQEQRKARKDHVCILTKLETKLEDQVRTTNVLTIFFAL